MTRGLIVFCLALFIANFFTTVAAAPTNEEDNDEISSFFHLNDLLKSGYSGQREIFQHLKKIIDPFQPKKEVIMEKYSDVATQFISGDGIESLVSSLATIPHRCIGPVRGFVDDELGDFITTDDSPYCDSRCFRNRLCCAPSRPEEAGVNFVYSNGKDQGRFVTRGDQAFYDDIHSTGKPLVVFIHGFTQNYAVIPHLNATRDGFNARGFNVILVDWSLSEFAFFHMLADIRIVGAMVGSMIRWLGYTHKTICIGISLGAAACGETGSWLKERGLLLPKCYGIDQAGFFHDGCSPKVRLDRTDCEVVVGIHTSGLMANGLTGLATAFVGGNGFGTTAKVGHCDFWVNSASVQPNCFNATPSNFLNNLIAGRFGQITFDVHTFIFCSHLRSEFLFRSQVNELCQFTGVRSINCDDLGECQPLDPLFIAPDDPAPVLMRFAPYDNCTSDMRADYHVTTTGTDPFC